MNKKKVCDNFKVFFVDVENNGDANEDNGEMLQIGRKTPDKKYKKLGIGGILSWWMEMCFRFITLFFNFICWYKC